MIYVDRTNSKTIAQRECTTGARSVLVSTDLTHRTDSNVLALEQVDVRMQSESNGNIYNSKEDHQKTNLTCRISTFYYGQVNSRDTDRLARRLESPRTYVCGIIRRLEIKLMEARSYRRPKPNGFYNSTRLNWNMDS